MFFSNYENVAICVNLKNDTSKPISDGYLGLINSTPIDYVEINISKKYHVWSKCIDFTRLSHKKALLLFFVYSLSLKSILYYRNYDYRQTDVLNVITNRLESKIIFSIHE